MTERNAETPEDKRILYRIDVNLGDVLIEADDIVGTASILHRGSKASRSPAGFVFPAQPTITFAAGSTRISLTSRRSR
jgi:hypothetical protein